MRAQSKEGVMENIKAIAAYIARISMGILFLDSVYTYTLMIYTKWTWRVYLEITKIL